jgi:transcriptional regulator with XRE-family HTH domain
MHWNSQLSDPEILRELGRRLRIARLQQNISLEDVARRAGLSKTTLTNMERGSDFRIGSLLRVLRVLNRLEAFETVLQAPALSPMELVRHDRKRPRQRAYSARPRTRRARDARVPTNDAPPPRNAPTSRPVMSPTFEPGTGVSRVGVPRKPGGKRG